MSSPHLHRWEKLGLGGLFLLLIGFGVLVEIRAAFLKRRMGDLSVFLRAAWAVRSGEDVYTITDENEWHYCYPPFFAILLMPLADPPAEAPAPGLVPYPVSVGLWFTFSVFCVGLAAHVVACAIEKDLTNRTVRMWWRLRLLPVLICLPPLASTLMRGQSNPLVLLLLCGMIALQLRGKGLLGGVCLGLATCVKVFPALLVIYPLWRRDGRALAGCGVGMFLGFILVPVLVMGPEKTCSAYRSWTEVMLRPALASGADQSRAKELIEVTATDSQSFLAIWHNSLHLNPDSRPPVASAPIRWAHWLAGGVLLLLTLFAGGWHPRADVRAEVVLGGMLMLVNILVSPVCHVHYFCLLLPMVMGLVASSHEGEGSARSGLKWSALFGGVVVGMILPHLPGMTLPRDLGLYTYSSLALWLAGWLLLQKSQTGAGLGSAHPSGFSAAA